MLNCDACALNLWFSTIIEELRVCYITSITLLYAQQAANEGFVHANLFSNPPCVLVHSYLFMSRWFNDEPISAIFQAQKYAPALLVLEDFH